MWKLENLTGPLLWYLRVSEMTCYFRLYQCVPVWSIQQRLALLFQLHDVQLASSYSCHPSVSHGEWWRVFNFNPRFVYFFIACGPWVTQLKDFPHDDGTITDMSVLTVKRLNIHPVFQKNSLPFVQKIIPMKEDVTRLKMVVHRFFQGVSFLSQYTRRCNFIYIRTLQAS